MDGVGIIVRYTCVNFQTFRALPNTAFRRLLSQWIGDGRKLYLSWPSNSPERLTPQENTMIPKALVYVLGGKAGDFFPFSFHKRCQETALSLRQGKETCMSTSSSN